MFCAGVLPIAHGVPNGDVVPGARVRLAGGAGTLSFPERAVSG
jgi:hypothetical protein